MAAGHRAMRGAGRYRPRDPQERHILERARARTEHVVVLMLENRSFDHLIGYLEHPVSCPGSPEFPNIRPEERFANPLDPTKPDSDRTAYPSPDAEYVWHADPPHSHISAKRQMNGRGWRNFKMDGFVNAYAHELKFGVYFAVIHWGRIFGAGLLMSPFVAAGFENLWELSHGRWKEFLLWFGGFSALSLAGVALQQISRVLHVAKSKLAIFGVVGAFVFATIVEGTRYRLDEGLSGFLPWLVCPVLALTGILAAAAFRKKKLNLSDDQIWNKSKNIMRCMRDSLDPAESKIPVLGALAREFAVCTKWFSSVPGATWPNRNFAHAGTSEESVDIEVGFYDAPTVFEWLDESFPDLNKTQPHKTWHIYCNGTPQVIAFPHLWKGDLVKNWFPLEAFFDQVRDPEKGLPKYSFIEPVHSGALSNSQHPGNNQKPTSGSSDFERGEELVRQIYNALRDNPSVFEKTIFLITYDEHGGLYDNEPPPRARQPQPLRYTRRPVELVRRLVAFFVEHRHSPFDFRCYGVRVPAIIVSPWIDKGCVDDTLYDHTSIIATLRRIFDLPGRPLTRRDKNANSFHGLIAERDKPRSPLPPLPPRGDVSLSLNDAGELSSLSDAEATAASEPALLGDPLEKQLVTLEQVANDELDQRVAGTPEESPERAMFAEADVQESGIPAGERLLRYADALRQLDAPTEGVT